MDRDHTFVLQIRTKENNFIIHLYYFRYLNDTSRFEKIIENVVNKTILDRLLIVAKNFADFPLIS